MSRSADRQTGADWTMWLSLGILGLFALHFWWLEVVAEDAYITFRFAKNLAQGHGFVWNIGEPPVEGYTNFLWLVICAGVVALGLDVALFSQVAGFLLALGSLALVYRWARTGFGLVPQHALIPCLLLAAAGPFATWAGSGMETTLFGFLLTLACWLFTLALMRGGRGWWSAWALVMVLCSMTRPEGVMVFCLLSGLVVLARLPSIRRAVAELALPWGFYLLLFGAYFAWRYDYFGWPLPNTFYAKTGGGADQAIRGVKHAIWFYLFFVVPVGLAFLPLLARLRLPGLPPLAEGRGGWIAANAPWIVPLMVVMVYSAYIAVVGGDYMAMFRFFAPLTPMIYLLLGGAIAALWPARPGLLAPAGLAAAVLAVLIQSTPLEAKIFPRMYQNHGTWRGVETERWHADRLAVIGRYFSSISPSDQASLATGGIGVIGYVVDMKVMGLHGLVDTHIAHKDYAPGELGSGLPGHERGDLDYIFAKRPTYFMYSRRLTEEVFGEEPKPLPAEAQAIVDAEYELVSVQLEDAANGEAGYFTYWEHRP